MNKKLLRKETSRVVRISGENYELFKQLKDLYGKKHRKPKVTYDEFLVELLTVARLIIGGREVYRVSARCFDDIAEARGAAITEAVQSGSVPRMPDVLIRVGEDSVFGRVL